MNLRTPLARLRRLPLRRLLLNKYVLVAMAALVWMLFFDSYNLVSQLGMQQKINELRQDRSFYREEIRRLAQEEQLLKHNTREMERIARERYLMKRPNEDVFVLLEPDPQTD